MKVTYEQITDDVKVDPETGLILDEHQTTEIRSIIYYFSCTCLTKCLSIII